MDVPSTLVLQAKLQIISRSYTGASGLMTNHVTAPSGISFGSRRHIKENRWGLRLSAADSNRVATDTSDKGSGNSEIAQADDQLSVVNPLSLEISAGNIQPKTSAKDESGPQTLESSNGSQVSYDAKQGTLSSPNMQFTAKRSSLTAREKLRAARVLSRNTVSKPLKSELGSKVLDAIRESDRGKKRSGLPEAPSNLFDDSKRGMPKKGLTFEFPGGFDLFLIIFSIVFISTVMFSTTYVVWKVGAIHFNE
ncbi:hypothetical protein HHK36_010702 [Tetracentron sinense]|uniref:Uncharacterized protein n=1 Tax=Tetracentron sinense TaxID=13715 RepID=A0A835DGJ9_TETSI|nr:hypothetical protein HHK36_010702 [Tetracentron sinense]